MNNTSYIIEQHANYLNTIASRQLYSYLNNNFDACLLDDTTEALLHPDYCIDTINCIYFHLLDAFYCDQPLPHDATMYINFLSELLP